MSYKTIASSVAAARFSLPMHVDPTRRFSNRVADYVRYRPAYPGGVISLLRSHAGLSLSSIVADVGSGTGISTAMFLECGHEVYAVEPNAEMRAASESLHGSHPGFHSVCGTSEATTLPDHCADLVVVAQAFHWFKPQPTRVEFDSILRPRGCVALMWNVRKLDATPFLRAYEDLLLDYATDYREVRHENVDEAALAAFFRDGVYSAHSVPNAQHFDFAGLRGRLLSCSYAPAEGHPAHAPMMEALREIYDAHEHDGRVTFEYDTKVYIGC